MLDFQHKEINMFMCYFCRIYKEAQGHCQWQRFTKIHKVFPNSTAHKTEQFVKGVWGLSSQVSKPLPVLVTVECICKMWHVYVNVNANVMNVGRHVASYWQFLQRNNILNVLHLHAEFTNRHRGFRRCHCKVSQSSWSFSSLDNR